jgi:hypothetical protein
VIPFIKLKTHLVLNFPGMTKMVPAGPLYDKVVSMIAANASDAALLNAVDPSLKITNDKSGLYAVKNGEVFVRNEKLPTSLGNRILDFANSGLPFVPLLRFWDNCKMNPDPRAQTDLYKFLEHNGHPITSDGCFIGYRNVKRIVDENGNEKFVDWQTGTFDNSIGKKANMRREDCDSNPDVTCSKGLHVAALPYASTFKAKEEGAALVEVKVNPRDVVAIPTDYNGQKMRVCELHVIAENKEGLISRPCYDPENIEEDDERDDELDDESGTEVHDALINDEDNAVAVLPRKVVGPRKSDKNHKKLKRDKYGHFLKSKKGKAKKSKRGKRK